MIGSRLKNARAKSGLSLRDLESKLGNLVSAQAIGKYERDEMMPSSKVLMALADALEVPENYLLSPSAIALEGVEFRKNRLTSKREEASVEASVLSAVERYLQIEDLLAASSATWAPPPGAPFRVRTLEDAESAAMRLRQLWQLGLDPVPSLIEFLEETGVKVIRQPLEAAVSGMMCFVRKQQDGRVPVIVISSNINGERQRFTLAHELGHLVLDVDASLDEEKASHRFAGAFLMPAEVLRAEVGEHRTAISVGELFQLKRLFGVSVLAIAYRCKDLGILSTKGLGQLFAVFTNRGWRKPPYAEPEEIQAEESTRFKRLCFRALAEGLISEAKAAELLETTVHQLARDMEGPRAAS